MPLRSFLGTSALLGCVAGFALAEVPALSAVASTAWWWGGVGLVTGATMLSRMWVSKAATKSPMGFVAAVNGSTAIKMFSLLALITTYLVTHEEGRVPYALGVFGVFVLQLVLFVWDVATSVRSSEKKS